MKIQSQEEQYPDRVAKAKPEFGAGDTVQVGNGSQRWLVHHIGDDDMVTVGSHPSYASSAGGRTQRRVVHRDKINGVWFRKGEPES